MATIEKKIYVLPNGKLWIDDANLPTVVTVERVNPQTGEKTFVPDVPINWWPLGTPNLPGLSIAALPKLIEQAARTLELENRGRINATSGPDDILGAVITLSQVQA